MEAFNTDRGRVVVIFGLCMRCEHGLEVEPEIYFLLHYYNKNQLSFAIGNHRKCFSFEGFFVQKTEKPDVLVRIGNYNQTRAIKGSMLRCLTSRMTCLLLFLFLLQVDFSEPIMVFSIFFQLNYISIHELHCSFATTHIIHRSNFIKLLLQVSQETC